jgi:hypothetical protein
MKGWKNESERHDLARQGIITRQDLRRASLGKFDEEWQLLLYPQYWTNKYFSNAEMKEIWKRHGNELRIMAKNELKKMGNDEDWIIHRDVANHLISLASDIKPTPDVLKHLNIK